MKFSNPWMKQVTINGKEYVESNGQHFFITLKSRDIDRVNYHCDLWDDRGVIATDDQGFHYVCLVNPRQNVTKRNLTQFLKDNRDWENSIPLLNMIADKFPDEFEVWLEQGSTIRIRDLAMRALEIDKMTVEFDNLVNPLDTGRHIVEINGSLTK